MRMWLTCKFSGDSSSWQLDQEPMDQLVGDEVDVHHSRYETSGSGVQEWRPQARTVEVSVAEFSGGVVESVGRAPRL
jgi:hypothetical protein